MKTYGAHGLSDFVLCLGHRGYMIKAYSAKFHLHRIDVTIDLATGEHRYHQTNSENWKVSLVDTGEGTLTAGRSRRVRDHRGGEVFSVTYGDGVGNMDISALLAFHKSHGKLAAVTAIQQPGGFGALDFDGKRFAAMREKAVGDGNWINGGFFVLVV